MENPKLLWETRTLLVEWTRQAMYAVSQSMGSQGLFRNPQGNGGSGDLLGSQNQCFMLAEVQHLSASRCRRKASNTKDSILYAGGWHVSAGCHSPLLASLWLHVIRLAGVHASAEPLSAPVGAGEPGHRH